MPRSRLPASRPPYLPEPSTRAVLPVLLAVLAVAPAWADEPPAAGAGARDPAPADPVVVIARTVQPRIAYRALPAEQNPVRVQATTFPAQVFHGTLDRTLDALIGEDALDQRGSAGVAGHVSSATATIEPALATGLAPLVGGGLGLGGGAAGAPPIGPGASIGAAVSGATAGIGDLITGSVLQAVSPAQQGGGP